MDIFLFSLALAALVVATPLTGVLMLGVIRREREAHREELRRLREQLSRDRSGVGP